MNANGCECGFIPDGGFSATIIRVTIMPKIRSDDVMNKRKVGADGSCILECMTVVSYGCYG